MTKLISPKAIAEIYELNAKKSLGQNFLFDLNITRKIVRESGDISNLHIIEVGSGPGGLTQAILEEPVKKLTAIEFDDRAINALGEIKNYYGDRFELIKGDALNIDLREIAEKPCAIMANLPYNISTKLLTNWLEYAQHFEFMTLMFQREVAERLAAETRTKDYGRLSVITQWLCDVEILFDVPPECFTPAPAVTSSVVKITPRKELIPANRKRLEQILAAGFNQRRKMLRSSVKSVLPNAEQTLTSLGIPPTARAEELSVADFCKISLHQE